MKGFSDLCFSISSQNDNIVEDSSIIVDEDVAIFNNCGNYLFSVPDDTAVIKTLIVNGGNVLNCAEDDISKIILKHRRTLVEIVYLPDDTKGGLFIRPYYSRGDRNGAITLRKVTKVTLKANGLPTLMQLYKLPALETIRIHVKAGTVTPDTITEKLLEQYPTLNNIEYVA